MFLGIANGNIFIIYSHINNLRDNLLTSQTQFMSEQFFVSGFYAAAGQNHDVPDGFKTINKLPQVSIRETCIKNDFQPGHATISDDKL